MPVKIKTLPLFIATATVALMALAKGNNNIAEEVAWMVGDQPIYKSEIEEQYQQMLYERTPIKGDPYCVIPEQIAIQKLFLHQADIDTVEVSDPMVQSEVDNYINNMMQRIGSKEKIEEYLRKPLPEIRETLTEQIRNNERIRQVQQSLTKNVKATPSDVRRYFTSLDQDSIPNVPLQVEVQIVSINPTIPRQEIEDVKARLRDYSDRVTRGESPFSTLAIMYSEDPGSATRGGELGFMGRAQLDPEFAAVAFNLNDPKKVSKIVESQYGYHIIQLIEKLGDRVNVRHILLRPKVSTTDLEKAIERYDTVYNEIQENKYTFEEATPYISQDKDTRNNRGVMINDMTGTTQFEMSQLPQEIALVVNDLEVGQISKPFIMKDPKRDRDIVAMVKKTSRTPSHKANMSDDYQLIKNMYEASQKQEIIKNWIEKKIKDTYVRIEEGWDECEFEHEGWIRTNK
ncbi:MAG: peptidylprolyl isomerase [Muribaculaceae bacterium]|nr:peptidylprolyl isomerase [Muribaculaceae bacterium]